MSDSLALCSDVIRQFDMSPVANPFLAKCSAVD
jgi:hypothetical protein